MTAPWPPPRLQQRVFQPAGAPTPPQVLRDVDFSRDEASPAGTVARIEADPNRSGFLALVRYEAGGVRGRVGRPGDGGRAHLVVAPASVRSSPAIWVSVGLGLGLGLGSLGLG